MISRGMQQVYPSLPQFTPVHRIWDLLKAIVIQKHTFGCATEDGTKLVIYI